MIWRDRWLGTLIVAGALAACVTDHTALERKPSPVGGTAGGGFGGSSGSFNQIGGKGGTIATGGGHADDEPPGKDALTLVNGVIDAPRITLCLAEVEASAAVVPLGSPLGDAPLEYGQSLVLHDLPGVDLATKTVQLFAIAGELELIQNLDCNAAIQLARAEEFGVEPSDSSGQGGAAGEAFAFTSPSIIGAGGAAEGGALGMAGEGGALEAPARLRVRALPALPAGTLNQGQSIAFVANGCLGGAGYRGPSAEAYCGQGYSERTPTVSAVLVSLSRRTALGYVGLQVVHASLANDRIEVSSQAPMPFGAQQTGLPITGDVVEGQVAPRPPTLSNSATDYGVAHDDSLRVSAPQGAPFSASWASVLARSGVAALTNGVTYALVFNGPRTDLAAVPELWNAPLLTLILADPE